LCESVYQHGNQMTEQDLDSDVFPQEIVELPLEDSLDLHSFPPHDIKSLVAGYLQEAYTERSNA